MGELVVDVQTILHGGPRFHTAVLTVRHWADRRAYADMLRRYRSNPHISDWFEEELAEPRRGGEEQNEWRIWLERPFSFRVEHRGSTHGGTFERTWHYSRGEERVYIDQRGSSSGVAFTTEGGGRSVTETELRDFEDRSPLFHVWLHPIVAELLDPQRLRLGEGQSSIESLEATRFHGRDAVRYKARINDWATRDPLHSENLWVADDYQLVVDSATGILLRLACRRDGQEFSVGEVTETVFDEPIDPALFEPPPGVRQKLSGSPIGRLKRWLGHRGPRRRLRRV